MTRLTRPITILALLAVILAACGSAAPTGGGATAAPGAAEKPVAGGTVTFALEDDPLNFDPLISRAFIERNVHYQMYDSLVRIDATGKIVPWLAEKWEFSDGDKTLTLSLRKDVKFHDGSTFDAEAVKWNLERYKTGKGSQRSGELAFVDAVEVVDASTVRLKMKAPFAGILAALVDRAGMMLSRKAVEAGGEDFTRNPKGAGSGPFKFVEAVKDDHITLEKNPDWWGKDANGAKLPYLDKILIRIIKDGSVRVTNIRTNDAQVSNNVAAKDVAALKTESDLVYREIPGLSYGSIIPNRAPGFIFNEARYVKAVSMAIDRQQILDQVFFGIGAVAYGPIAPPHFAYDKAFKPYEKADPEGAKKLVAEVGRGPLKFEMLVSSGDAQILQLAQLIQAQLKKADITLDINVLQFNEILKLQTDHAFKGTTLVGWSGRIDPDLNVYDFVYTKRPNNDGLYSNPQVDKLLDDQRSTTDQAKRKDALRKAEQIFAVDDPSRIWYRFGVAQLLTVKKLQGLEPYPDQLIRFQYAWFKT